MRYLIGADEAGYGPNLGPLVIGSTLWRVPDGVEGEELYDRLPGVLSPGDSDRGNDGASLRIGDSKSLFSPGGGLADLERAVFAALRVTSTGESSVPETWRSLLERCDRDSPKWTSAIPWYADYDRRVPCDATADAITESTEVLGDALRDSGIELVAVRAKLAFPQEFNARVEQTGSKGSALSLWTLELVSQQLQSAPEGSVLIQCDKHGGRNRYAALIQHVFPDSFIEVREERRDQSTYMWGPSSRRIEARFIAKGERILPTALASMFAKYLRELAMDAFNEYWQSQVPDLKPTAGYPVDAKRFRQDIESQRSALGISEAMLWRNR